MEEIADVYARSLFEVATEHDSLDRVHEELDQFADELDGNRDLQLFFFSPYFSSQEKKDAVGKLLDDADEHFVRFLELLAERHRMPAVFRIRRQLDELWAKENKLLEVMVTSAVELDDDVLKSIGDRIADQTGRRIDMSSNVDPEVLGGLVVQVGNMVLDASVRNRLESLRKNVAKAAA
jgi:F-type H+-transporting ATPase subunit delta